MKPYKSLARQKKLNFMNKKREMTQEIQENDFFDNQALGHQDVVVDEGVMDAIPMTDEIGGNDFFDDDNLIHREIVRDEGIEAYGQGDDFF